MIQMNNVSGEALIKTINSCESPVTIHDPDAAEDLRNNRFAQAMLRIAAVNGAIENISLDVNSEEDTARFLQFLMDTDVA